MRITSRQLRQIIQEEVARMMDEAETGEETIVVDPKTGKTINGPSAANLPPGIKQRFAADQARANEIARKVEGNAYMNIMLGSDIMQPFMSDSGKGILKLTVFGPGTPDAISSAQVKSAPDLSSALKASGESLVMRVRHEVLDGSGGSKLSMGPDGADLMRKIAGRIKNKMLPKDVPLGSFVIKLPFTWSPGKLVLGDRGGSAPGFGGGENYTADKVLGGVTIQGIGFR